MSENTSKGLWWHFVTWFAGGSGATLGYLFMTWLWKKIVGA